MRLSNNEVDVLRRLGEKYMEYANLPIQREKMNMWKALNGLKPIRPMVDINELPWGELVKIAPEQLTEKITDPYWRCVEGALRRKIFQWENFPADMILEPFVDIAAAMNWGYYGISPSEEHSASSRYNNLLQTWDDIEKIKDISFVHDEKQTEANLQDAQFIFGGIAPTKLYIGERFHLGMWDMLTRFMGVEAIYYDIIDRPDFAHALMRRITDATLAGIKSLNDLRMYDDNLNILRCSYTYTNEFLPDFGAGKSGVSKNCWALGTAQLFTSVSPDTTEEFEIPYISELAKEFGFIYYGCCERLDDRLDLVKKIPNVRKISCSSWSDREAFAKNLGNNFVMSAKPTPSYLSGGFKEDVVRDDIIRYCDAAKENGLAIELLLKDITTINNDLAALKKWHDIAMEVVAKY